MHAARMACVGGRGGHVSSVCVPVDVTTTYLPFSLTMHTRAAVYM